MAGRLTGKLGQAGYNLPTRLWRGAPVPAKLTIGDGVIGVGAGCNYLAD